jgi:transcriptional regulator of arginine metabolism
MRTIPGGAQSAAVALDSQGWPELLGTVGGDDTVLIICRSASGRQKLLQRIREIGERG